jgi:hypothetical protein
MRLNRPVSETHLHSLARASSLTALLVLSIAGRPAAAGTWTLVGWNNLGMHCMDGDYSVFSLLPPYNTINAQLIDPNGNLVTNPAGITVTYQAVADPDGSINATSQGKTNFWQFVLPLFGASPAVDVGLTGVAMPGAGNQPQPMSYDSALQWFIAEGIPLTPYDDTQTSTGYHKNPYPLMRLVARDSSNAILATTDIVLPVSDEMDCSACHASGSGPAAQPQAGWVNDPNPQRDMRLNILRVHDDRQGGSAAFQNALAALEYNTAGLFTTATVDGKPILCAACHASVALGALGQPGVPALTASMHSLHAQVVDPITNLTLDSSSNRSACYRCHPGSTTRCLRGAMGAAVAPDGTMEMQCQSCHGSMSAVGAPNRTGWLNEPACQECHTGTATNNNGQIRYTSVFDNSGQPRVAADQTFATNPGVPAAGFSLYRFSSGHGGLQCEACHGSTHAEFPSSHRNDNIQSIQHQGHVGMFVECVSCHGTQPATVNGGPHRMHPVGQAWVDAHGDAVGEGNTAQCQACHGIDYRGTVLSRSKADRALSTDFGGKVFWRGFQIGCYTCHLGPANDAANPNRPAVVTSASAATAVDAPVSLSLGAADPDGNPPVLRIVSQPANGTVGLSGTVATYFPFTGFTGGDSFTFAAWDGSTDSNLGTVSVAVGGVGPSPTATPISAQTPQATPPTEEVLTLTRAKLRAALPTRANGSAKLAGTFTVASGSSFDASGGLAIRVRATGFDQTQTWAPAECQATGSTFRCTSADRSAGARFVPASHPGRWLFTTTLRRLAVSGPFAGPVTATLTQVDTGASWAGTVTTCSRRSRVLVCRQD